MKLTATITDAAPFLVSKSEYGKIGRGAIEAAGKLWHSTFKRRHFQIDAFQRYKYRPRTKKWEAIKFRKHPESGGRPLVFTGESEQLAMSQSRVTTRVPDWAHYRAEVTVSAPKLNFHANEMTRTTPEEDAELQEIFAKVFIEGVAGAWKSHGLSSAKIELGRQQLSAA